MYLKTFLSLNLQIIWPLYNVKKSALDITYRKCVTWLNSAEWDVLSYLPHLKDWSCSSTCPDKMSLGGRLKGYSWICLQFLHLFHQQRSSIAQLICALSPVICKPAPNRAAWHKPQTHHSRTGMAETAQLCSWLKLSFVLPASLAASLQRYICR